MRVPSALPEHRGRARVCVYIRNRCAAYYQVSFKLPTEIRPHHCYVAMTRYYFLGEDTRVRLTTVALQGDSRTTPSPVIALTYRAFYIIFRFEIAHDRFNRLRFTLNLSESNVIDIFVQYEGKSYIDTTRKYVPPRFALFHFVRIVIRYDEM